MSMILLFSLLVFFITLFFYLLVPGLGALITLDRWRKFRRKLVKISMYPLVEYSDIARTGEHQGRGFRFFGRLESIHGENRIWITNGSISLEADLSNIVLYFLPSIAENDESGSDEIVHQDLPVSTKWKRIFSLPEGTKIFVGGTLVSEGGHSVFRSSPRDPLLVVIYDGDERTILERAIRCGRQKNEYWNQFTLISLVTGFLSLLLLSYVLIQDPLYRLPALLALALGLLPLATFMPPGVIGFFFYRRFWIRSRNLRRERDRLRLPLRYFGEKDVFPGGEQYRMTTLPDSGSYIMIGADAARIKGFIPDGSHGVISASLGAGKGDKANESVIFGAYSHTGETGRIGQPKDPMADFIEIKGNPERLAILCDKKAKLYAFLSICCIVLEIGINFFIALYGLSFLLR